MSLYLATQWKENIQIWRFWPFFPQFWWLKTFYVSAGPSIFFLSSFSFVDLPFELPSFWASLSLVLCVFFLCNNKQAKKFGAWRSVGSFLHSSLHTLQVCGFSYSNSWNVVCFSSVASFWIGSVELWVLVFFHFGFGPLVHTCIRSEQIWAMQIRRRGAAGAWTPLHS